MSKPDKKVARETQTINVFFEHNQFLPLLYGERDAHLKRLEQALNVELVARGNMLSITGNKRDIGKPTLEKPMGSGPYVLAEFSPGRSITYQRNPDYWATGEGFAVGQNNFDQVKYEFFLDTTAQFEGFKGDEFDWWDENLALRVEVRAGAGGVPASARHR